MLKDICDGTAVSITVATLAGWMPAVSGVLTVIWMCIRIYESRTVQGWLNKGRTDER